MIPSAPLSGASRAAVRELADALATLHRKGQRVIGINGAQGSGKSTLAAHLVAELGTRHFLKTLAVSLDDFYLGRRERNELARTVHPLFATRGVPGTHQVERGIECFERLAEGKPCALPAFSKADDDALGPEHDRIVAQPPDLILFEGWCVGTPPQDPAALEPASNDLERNEDADGTWRRHVNDQLAGRYATWFGMLDALAFLRVPSWGAVRRWRAQQELETAMAGTGSALMDADGLERFLQHYQRLTTHALATLPAVADLVVEIDEQHAFRVAR